MIDLRKRKEIGLLEYYAGDLSKTTRRIEIIIKEVGDDVKEMHFGHATSGTTILPIIRPKGAMWRELKDKSKRRSNPFFNRLKEEGLQKILDDLFARKGGMRTFYLTVPKIEGAGQQILYQLKYCNSFQGRDFEWAGKYFSADTDVLKMKIAFPEKKPFKSYKAYKKAAGTEEKTGIEENNRIENPDIKTEGNQALVWTIRDAKEGEKYFIMWTW